MKIKNLRIKQLLKIYHKAQGAARAEIDCPFHPGQPWVMVATFDNGHEISMERYDYCKKVVKQLKQQLLIP